jgi:hypothetical protein
MMPPDLECEHPVDILIERSADVRRAFRRVLSLEKAVRVAPGSEAAFRDYSDARLALQIARETIAVNVGIEVGTLVARAEPRGRTRPSAGARAFEQELRRLVLTADLPTDQRLSALLRFAAGIARGPLPAPAVAEVAAPPADGRTATARRSRRLPR